MKKNTFFSDLVLTSIGLVIIGAAVANGLQQQAPDDKTHGLKLLLTGCKNTRRFTTRRESPKNIPNRGGKQSTSTTYRSAVK